MVGRHDGRVPPIVLTFMLTCYVSPCPSEELGYAHWDSTAGKETRQWLRDNNLIDCEYNATERGRAWVEFICRTPLPVAKWVRPEDAGGIEYDSEGPTSQAIIDRDYPRDISQGTRSDEGRRK